MTLFLKWSQWLRAEAAAAGETLLFVNLDETAVAQLVPHRRGCVMPAGTGARASPVERIKRSESHGHLTLMAAIAGDADFQACLPQWVLPKDAGLTRAERARMRRLADPLVFVPGTSGWVSVESLCPLLTHLRRVVRARRPGHRLVVAWDAASQHVNILVLRHARRLGIHVLLIPAGLTWLLQPLDSHVFASFKRTAHRLQLEARASTDAGVLQRTGWIDLLETAVLETLVRRSWARSLVRNGVTGDVSDLRPRVRACLREGRPPEGAPLNDEEMSLLLGRPRVGLARLLCSPFPAEHGAGIADEDGEAVPPPPLPPPAHPPPMPASLAEAPIAARTRSRTRAAGVDQPLG